MNTGGKRAFGLRLGCVVALFSLSAATPAWAEWYVAGFGGSGPSPKVENAHMDTLGEQRALQTFPTAANPTVASFTQSFSTSDLGLKTSALYGAKLGYFFREEKLPWLGVEVEAFTSTPTIKAQTLSTEQTINFTPKNITQPCQPAPNATCPVTTVTKGSLAIAESSLRVITVAFNVVARYPGTVFQPYVGIGAGAFYFKGENEFNGRQVAPGFNAQAGIKVLATEEWGLFVEGKYNRATVSAFDPKFGLSGDYSAFQAVAGIAYHF